jgi:hypothetical protein
MIIPKRTINHRRLSKDQTAPLKRINKQFSNDDDDDNQHHRAPTAAIRIARASAIALLVTLLLVALVPLRKGIHNIDSILINNAVPNQRQEQEEVPTTTTIHTEDEGKNNNTHGEKRMKKAKVAELNQRQIHFFGPTAHLNDRTDAFSASWLQRKEEFMSMNFAGIVSCEDASFVAFSGGTPERFENLRMTVDWFDFAIEHMSKWHKMLSVFQEDAVYQTAIAKFDRYISGGDAKGAGPLSHVDNSFRETIAVVAFQAIKHDEKILEAYKLPLVSLGATVESLRRAGFERMVVVGLNISDATVCTRSSNRNVRVPRCPRGSQCGDSCWLELASWRRVCWLAWGSWLQASSSLSLERASYGFGVGLI